MYITKFITDLVVDQKTSSEDVFALLMNEASLQIEGCVDNLGSFADIVSIEHFETHSVIAEKQHISLTTMSGEIPGNSLPYDNSSVNVEDYDYCFFTKMNVSENE